MDAKDLFKTHIAAINIISYIYVATSQVTDLCSPLGRSTYFILKSLLSREQVIRIGLFSVIPNCIWQFIFCLNADKLIVNLQEILL